MADGNPLIIGQANTATLPRAERKPAKVEREHGENGGFPYRQSRCFQAVTAM
jgi:hypothetical protein